MKERTLYTACPLCDSTELFDLCVADCTEHAMYKPSLSPHIHWRQCRSCQHVFTNGYFTEAACAILFSSTHSVQMVGHEIERYHLTSARMVEKVLPFVSRGVWLDVGFGNGSLLFTAQEYGFQPVGTDLRSDNVKALAELGIPSYAAELSDLEFDEPCAVISMADVLEHMPYPKEGLLDAHALLQDGGVLLISMPNSDSMLWKLMNRDGTNPYWGEIEHYHNFSRSRLYALLEETGFKPVRYGVSERYRACMEIIAVKQS